MMYTRPPAHRNFTPASGGGPVVYLVDTSGTLILRTSSTFIYRDQLSEQSQDAAAIRPDHIVANYVNCHIFL